MEIRYCYPHIFASISAGKAFRYTNSLDEEVICIKIQEITTKIEGIITAINLKTGEALSLEGAMKIDASQDFQLEIK